MKTIIHASRPLVPTLLVLTSFTASLRAQEVSIPDSGLNAAIRQALNKPVEPLTEQDMLGLTFLNTSGRSRSNMQGLEAARDLNLLDLDSNSLTNFVLRAR